MLRNIFIKSPLIIFQSSKNQTKSIIPAITIPKDITFQNEQTLKYEKGSMELGCLEKEISRMSCNTENIPIVIGGKEYQSDCELFQVMPFEHGQKVAKYYYANSCQLQNAIKLSTEYQQVWDRTTFEERSQIWENAADLMAGKYRQQLNAATILGQGKTIIQAEIDSAAELIDFFRSNTYFFSKLLQYKPISSNPNEILNHIRFRGLEGFVAAITPFNFTALSGNMAYAPVLAGNSVLWKPADTAILSNWIIFKILLEAGLPPEIVHFVPSNPIVFRDTVTKSPNLAGINYCGTTCVFKDLWRSVSDNLDNYFNFPVLSGECSGKNFHFVHPSASVKTVVACTIRSAFEYSGQKCSACSKLFVPESLWNAIRDGLIKAQRQLKVGDPRDYSVFTSALIDQRAYEKVTGAIEEAKKNSKVEIIAGGNSNSCFGYYVEPTIIQVDSPNNKIMIQEIFGPILAVYVYPDMEMQSTIDIIKLAPYALTGSVFAQDPEFLEGALEEFKMSAGNLYINDKSTGAIVGQQPFGGRRMSGTNDKAGGPFNILRWMDIQSIKETFVEQSEIRYPYMGKIEEEEDISSPKPETLPKLKKQKTFDLKNLKNPEFKKQGCADEKEQIKDKEESPPNLDEPICPGAEIKEPVYPAHLKEQRNLPQLKEDINSSKSKEEISPDDSKEEKAQTLKKDNCSSKPKKENSPPKQRVKCS